MIVTIASTEKIVQLNNIPARIWEGITDSGIKCHCYVTRIAIDKDDAEATAQFEKELTEHRVPSAEIAAIPLRMVL